MRDDFLPFAMAKNRTLAFNCLVQMASTSGTNNPIEPDPLDIEITTLLPRTLINKSDHHTPFTRSASPAPTQNGTISISPLRGTRAHLSMNLADRF